jgi:hypothetical protein
MNRLSLFAMLATALVAEPALAVEAHHPDQNPGAAAATGSVTAPPAPADAAKSVDKMKSNLEKMRQQLDRIAGSKAPEERQKLLQEHMQTMRENIMMSQSLMMGGTGAAPGMGMMSGMGSGGMMGSGMMGMCPMMGMMGGGMAPEFMMDRMQQMEKRLDMMQMVMERMLKPQAQSAQK